MIKISRTEAYQGMNEIDFKVYDQETYELQQWSIQNKIPLDLQFYLNDSGDIVLQYFRVDTGQVLHNLFFKNKARLTKQGEEAIKSVGRPSLGVTKKVSITTTPEIWQFINKIMEKKSMSQSEVFRNILDEYYKMFCLNNHIFKD